MRTLLLILSLLTLAVVTPVRGDVIQGVITRHGLPVEGYHVTFRPSGLTAQTDEQGFYRIEGLEGIEEGTLRITRVGSFRTVVPFEITGPVTEISCDLVPHFTADHGPLEHDWRLHRSWGNALDDPFDLYAPQALEEQTHTLSGLLLKPVQLAATGLELLWRPVGIGAGLLLMKAPLPGDEHARFTSASLAGFLPIEAVAKTAEVSMRTLLWPIDRLVSRGARRDLHALRARTLAEHASAEELSD
jgi:hypothetical protein